MSWEDVDDDRCYECTGYGDDYSEDEDGNMVSNCTDCPYNSANQEDWQVNDMEELKKCPFCGGEAELEYTESYSSHRYYFVQCTECGCKSDDFEDDPGMKKAVAAWNNRKPVDDVLEHLEEELNFADVEKKRCAKENQLQFDSAKGCAQGLYNAIIVIKEGLM